MECKCISYYPYTRKPRESYQTIPPRVVIFPFTGEAVEIDECIADTMIYLWAQGVKTASCCCGHNESCGPTCILWDPYAGEKEFDEVREVIKDSGDQRQWGFLSAPARVPYLNPPSADSFKKVTVG